MKIHGDAEPRPIQMDARATDVEAVPARKHLERRLIEPCDYLFRFILGEFFGTLVLTFFGAHFLILAQTNLTVSVFCTGSLRYLLAHVLGQPILAISLGRLFCLRRQVFISVVVIAGQFFGSFIGQVLFAAVLGNTVNKDLRVNDAIAEDSVPLTFQSYFLLEVICTLLFVIVFLKTENPLCMAAVQIMTMTLSFEAGNKARPAGNVARALAQSSVGAIWRQAEPWKFMDAVFAAAFITPFMAAAVYWLLNTAKEMSEEDSNDP